MVTRFAVADVTAGDIALARRHDQFACPMALALRRVGYQARVGSGYWLGAETWACWVELPLTAQRFITRFDLGLPVKPARFRLRLPSAALRLPSA